MPVDSNADNAGVAAPAPVIYGAAIAIGLIAEFAVPVALPARSVSTWLGAFAIAISIPIAICAFRTLARSRTAFDARKPTSSIVTDGPFRYARNPTYLSLTLVHIGVALVFGLPWVLAMVVPAVAVVHWGVVLREERYLEAKFGEEYRRYAAKVRRWA